MRSFVEFKGMFFDKQKILSAADKAAQKVLSKFGAFVRTTAKQSIRTKKGYSKPGQPPHSKTGLLKRFIFFGYDKSQASVVVGPALLSGKNKGQAPSVLEYGGYTKPSNVINYRRKRKLNRVKIEARPYMNPALNKELPKLPDMWRNSVN